MSAMVTSIKSMYLTENKQLSNKGCDLVIQADIKCVFVVVVIMVVIVAADVPWALEAKELLHLLMSES